MHPVHEAQINQRYQPRTAECWQAQLDDALHGALTTNKEAATYWVEEVENLVGRTALARAGGTIRDALKFIDEANRHYTKGIK